LPGYNCLFQYGLFAGLTVSTQFDVLAFWFQAFL
jgi:hypothetical protein